MVSKKSWWIPEKWVKDKSYTNGIVNGAAAGYRCCINEFGAFVEDLIAAELRMSKWQRCGDYMREVMRDRAIDKCFLYVKKFDDKKSSAYTFFFLVIRSVFLDTLRVKRNRDFFRIEDKFKYYL